VSIEILEGAMKKLVHPGAQPKSLASGFQSTEGPAWNEKEYSLYFSDIPADTVFRYSEIEGVQIFR
jgi:gluconolactonase